MNHLLRTIIVISILQSIGYPVLKAQILSNALGYYNDAFRYSKTNFGGTARVQGMGGAFTAIGGDMSSITGNPAGLGYNRRSEISFSGSANFSNAISDYAKTQKNETKFNFNAVNFGVIISRLKPDDEEGKWRGLNFGVSFSRINNFQNEINYEGTNTSSSILDNFVEQSNGIPASSFQGLANNVTTIPQLGYFSYAVVPDNSFAGNQYFHYFTGKTLNQYNNVITKGGQNQWSAAIGGNISDRFYFGASIGLQTMRYEYKRGYTETDIGTNAKILNYITFEDHQITGGTGLNFTGGLIYRLANVLRIGASFASPTYYRINQEKDQSLKTDFNNFDNGNGVVLTTQKIVSVPQKMDYALVTPYKATIGAAFFVGKFGLLTADLEYVDYRTMKLLSTNGIDFQADNQTIKNIYKAVYNLRMGFEIRIKQFRVQGGYAYYEDPYQAKTVIKNDIRTDGATHQITAGFGIRTSNFYADFAGRYIYYKSLNYPYTLKSNVAVPVASIRNSFYQLTFSTGFYF